MLRAFLAVALFAVAFALTHPAGTRVRYLPDLPSGQLPSMYSGYVVVNETAGRAIFYILVEARNVDPTTAPLVFWYNGGPGCSGLGGFFSEHGPVTPNGEQGLETNPLSWTNIANIVYLEQPAGVGFSYSNTSSDSNTGDIKATIDNFAFVQNFLKLYPDYIGRDTWFAGESYGGVYVPSLTATVLSDSTTQIYKQFKGFMVGNPVFNCGTSADINVQLNTYYWHGLISYSRKQQWDTQCANSQTTPFCQNLWQLIQTQIGVINQQTKKKKQEENFPVQPSLDPDDLYENFCSGNASLDYVSTQPVDCFPEGIQVMSYLNRPDVQMALHAKGPNGGQPNTWVDCTDALNYDSTGVSMVPYYANFQNQKPGVQVLVYSGDVDIATVPFSYTSPCLGQLNATNNVPWQPWFVNGQTAGYWEQFSPVYTHATIKGGGHEAPQYQPLSSFYLFQRFLNSQSLSDESHHPRNFPMSPRRKRQGDVLRALLQQQKRRK